MKAILTFIGGTLFGALAVFLLLRQIGDDPAPPVTVAATAPAPSAAQAGAVGLNDLPPDLADANLPIRPYVPGTVAAQGESVAMAPNTSSAGQPQSPAPAPASGAAATPTGTSGNPTQPDPAGLAVPVEGVQASQLTDMFDQARGSERHHEALDIMAPRGTRVLATADGTIAKLFESKAGGLTVYQFNPAGTHAYYYAHLDRYAEGLKEGAAIKKGDLIGYVGNSGNADPSAPHLHFAVFALTPEKKWWKGTPINPYPLLAGTSR